MRVFVYCVIAALLGTAVACVHAGDEVRNRTAVEDGVEMLTRGPVHEAFAVNSSIDLAE
jgi:hypothetical protein